MIKAVISVVGQDQKGVVARFATYVAEHGINIQDIKQQVVHGQFIMDMLVDLADMNISLDQLVTGLLDEGRKLGMDVRLALHDQRRSKKIALLVSKETHCLQQLIDDQAHGCLRGQIDCVLSNHPNLEALAAKAGLPFEYMPSTDKPAHMAWLLERLKARQIDLVVLARYMQIVSPEIV